MSKVFSEETTKALNAALNALDREQSADHGRWSDKALAKRLRAKRLKQAAPEEFDPRTSIIATLREIDCLVCAPWEALAHPFTSLLGEHPHKAPVKREMGANALALFADLEQLTTDGTVRLSGLDVAFERSASAGRTAQHLNEVRWYLNGQLAIAWNVVQHRVLIEQWDTDFETSPTTAMFNASKALPKCARVHAGHPSDAIDFYAISEAHDVSSRRGHVTLGAKVRHRHPTTVWGNVPVASDGNGDTLALHAALSSAQRFRALL